MGKPLIGLGINGVITKLTTITSPEIKHVCKYTYLENVSTTFIPKTDGRDTKKGEIVIGRER